MAFRARFQIYESKWYLEINPTYHFTWNGRRDRFYEERLRRIKQIERQPRVFAELCMWADLLVEPPSLLQPNHDFLRFGQLLELDSPVSIDDMAWLPQENQQEIMALREHTDQMPLF